MFKMAEEKMVLVCSVCGGLNVQIKAWIDPNNYEVSDASAECDEDTWCNNCEEHTGLNLKAVV